MTILIELKKCNKVMFDELKSIGFYFLWFNAENVLIELLGNIEEDEILKFIIKYQEQYSLKIYTDEVTKGKLVSKYKINEIYHIDKINPQGYKMLSVPLK